MITIKQLNEAYIEFYDKTINTGNSFVKFIKTKHDVNLDGIDNIKNAQIAYDVIYESLIDDSKDSYLNIVNYSNTVKSKIKDINANINRLNATLDKFYAKLKHNNVRLSHALDRQNYTHAKLLNSEINNINTIINSIEEAIYNLDKDRFKYGKACQRIKDLLHTSKIHRYSEHRILCDFNNILLELSKTLPLKSYFKLRHYENI